MRFAQSNRSEEGWQVAFFAGCVDQAPGCEGCCIECAEAGSRDEEGENERANGAEDLAAESHGDGVGGLDDVRGQHEEVGYVGEDVAENYEGEGGVDYAGEVAGGVFELGRYIVDLEVC